MRFCPFCAQENPDDARECGHCGKRLPAPRAAPPRPVAPAPVERKIVPRPTPRSRPIQPPQAPPPQASPPHAAHPMEQRDVPARSAPEAPTLPPPGVTRDPHATNPNTKAPTGTLLGVPSPDPVTAPSRLPPPRPTSSPPVSKPMPSSTVDSGKRTTKPISVNTAADAVKGKGPVSGHAPTVSSSITTPIVKASPPVKAMIDEDESTTVQTPRSSQDSLLEIPLPPVDQVDSNPMIVGDRSVDDAATDVRGPNYPRMDSSATPAIPTLALPPMPKVPKGGSILDAVKYLPPLAKAIWARKKAQKSIRELLHGDQRLLDQVLRDLGRAAREAKLDVPAVADEMRRVRQEEDRRAKAESTMLEISANVTKELERWATEEAERSADLQTRDMQIRGAEEELKKKGDERRVHEAERARIDALIRASEKKAAQEDARAAKADVTPPEKGGGPNTAANARAAAEAARKEATALIPSREEAKERVDALEAPIATLTKQVVDGRAALGEKRKELVEATAAHKRTLTEFEADKRRCEAEREGAEREMSQRFVSAGTLLNLNRVEDSRFQSLYGRIDELKNGVNAREATIVRLESERRTYDRAVVQKGLLALGIALGAIVLLAIVLMVVFSR
jgi:hypothetical protein